MKKVIKKLPIEKQSLVIDNMKLVTFALKKFHSFIYDSYDDLFQEGCIGLIEAAISFDPSKEYKFSTYAIPMIIGEIRRYKRDCSLVSARRYKDLEYKLITYLRSHDFEYNEDKIIKTLNISSSEYSKLIGISEMISYDSLQDLDDKTSSVEHHFYDPRDHYQKYEDSEFIKVAITNILSKVNQKKRDLYEEYLFSLEEGEKLNQGYLAKKYNLSQAQVSRLLRSFSRMLSIELDMKNHEKSEFQ